MWLVDPKSFYFSDATVNTVLLIIKAKHFNVTKIKQEENTPYITIRHFCCHCSILSECYLSELIKIWCRGSTKLQQWKLMRKVFWFFFVTLFGHYVKVDFKPSTLPSWGLGTWAKLEIKTKNPMCRYCIFTQSYLVSLWHLTFWHHSCLDCCSSSLFPQRCNVVRKESSLSESSLLSICIMIWINHTLKGISALYHQMCKIWTCDTYSLTKLWSWK